MVIIRVEIIWNGILSWKLIQKQNNEAIAPEERRYWENRCFFKYLIKLFKQAASQGPLKLRIQIFDNSLYLDLFTDIFEKFITLGERLRRLHTRIYLP